MKSEVTIKETASMTPLEMIEWMADSKGWQVREQGDGEIALDVATKFGNIGMFFLWSDELKLLQISAILEANVDPHTSQGVYELLSLINEKLFLGHFSLLSGTNFPIYRNSTILNGNKSASQEQIHDLLDIAFEEAYRYFAAFQNVAQGADARSALSLSVPDYMGVA